MCYDGAGEAIEGELAAALIEQDVGAHHGYVVARRLDDAPSAPDVYTGTVRTLGSWIIL